MDPIELELSELSALEFENFPYLTLSSICKNWPISTKLGHNIYAHKVSDEFDSRTSRVICPWIWIWKFAIFDLVYTLASASIDQSVPNLATMYMPIRCLMSLIAEHPELFALEFGKLLNLTVYTLVSTNINQSTPNLVKMYVTIRSRMNLIMDLIRPVLSELFALNFKKNSVSDFVYSLASTNLDQLVPNMVTIYLTMKLGWVRL